MLKNKLTIVLTAIKVLISIFITCLILTKGDAGILIHHIGYFLVGGNYIVGLSSLANVTLLYILAMYNLTINHTQIKKLKQFLLIFDFSLIIINLVLGTCIATVYYRMQFNDAISKIIILGTGSAMIYYIMSLIIILLISKTQNNLSNNLHSSFTVNNNPFTFIGRMEQIPYLITKSSMLVILLIAVIIIKHCGQPEFSVILTTLSAFVTFLVGLFAASKRLRDIKWSQLFLIIWAIPFLGLVIGIPLLFIKTKQVDN